MAHLIDDETVAKMGHPDLDVGHPAEEEKVRSGRWTMCAAPGERRYSVASSFGLHSGLRQSGGRFAAVFYGTAEAVPLSKTDRALRDGPPYRR
jgi:hypothetical protein